MKRIARRWKSWGTVRRVLYPLIAVGVLLGLGGFLWAGLTVAGVTGPGCPPIAELRTYRPPEATRVFAVDGSVVADLSPQRRVVLDIEEVPPLLREAVVAVEDRRFWDHGGVDFRGVARALWRNVTGLGIEEGFSTITMQLTRNIFPDQLPMREKVTRKVCEVYLAYRVEAEFQKREILELYLNQIYLGGGLYGVEAAAQGYFGTSVSEISPAEAALLVALVKSPEGYNPRKNPRKAVERRNIVLGVMAEAGVIERAEADAARAGAPGSGAADRGVWTRAVLRGGRTQTSSGRSSGRTPIFGGCGSTPASIPRSSAEPDPRSSAQIDKIEQGGYGRYSHAKGPARRSGGRGAAGAGDRPGPAHRRRAGARGRPRLRHVTVRPGLPGAVGSRAPRSSPIVYAAALESGLPAHGPARYHAGGREHPRLAHLEAR